METVVEAPALPRRVRRRGHARVWIGVVLILAAVTVLVLSARQDGVVYYKTVSELLALPPSADLRGLRVTGKVVPGSTERAGGRLRFLVTDGEKMVPVTYAGVVPETFTDDSEVVVEGRYVPQGDFEASGLLTKCPSKYQAEQKATGGEHPDGVSR